MRRSKARDLADLEVNEPPIEFAGFSYRVIWTPQVGLDRTPIHMNFEFLKPLGQFGSRLLKEFLIQLRELDRPKASNRYYYVVPFLKKIAAKAAVSPETWSGDKWKMLTDDHIMEVRRRTDVADTTKREYQYKIVGFLNTAWKRGVLPRFKVIPSPRNVIGEKKLSIGAAQAEVDLDELADPQLDAVANRLRELTDVNDPAVHLQRTDILIGLLRTFMEDEARKYWKVFCETEEFLSDPDGIDVEAFLADQLISRSPLMFKRGWSRKLKTERDAVRFLAYPEVFPLLLNTESTTSQVRLWLVRREGGIQHMRDRLHSTPDNILPFIVLLLLGLASEKWRGIFRS